jgi:hypothetical protein
MRKHFYEPRKSAKNEKERGISQSRYRRCHAGFCIFLSLPYENVKHGQDMLVWDISSHVVQDCQGGSILQAKLMDPIVDAVGRLHCLDK